MSCLHCAAPSFHYWLARCLTAVQILQTQDSKRYHMQLVPQACQCVLEIHAPTHQKNISFSISHGRKEVSLQHSEMQTQIGAKDMQMHLHNSDQSELCDGELFMVCLEPAHPTKARLQETWNDYIKQRKENKVWPNKSRIHLHNIKCSCFTCFLSIVVSRPVFVASHRGVIQECLVCTARHPAFIID